MSIRLAARCGLPSACTMRVGAARLKRALAAAAASAGAAAGGAAGWLQTNFAEATEPPLPTGADVCVVGAGVVGVATAYELARAGYRVRVLEAGGEVCSPAAASWGNAGTMGVSGPTAPLCTFAKLPALTCALVSGAPEDTPAASWEGEHARHQRNMFLQGSALRDPYLWAWGLAYARLLLGSAGVTRLQEHWRAMVTEALAETLQVADAEGLRARADVRVEGRMTLLMEPPAGRVADAARASVAQTVAAREPALRPLAPMVAAATVTPGDSQGSCAEFTRALAGRCRDELGVDIHLREEAVSLIVEEGRAVGVATASGGVLHTDAVVVCAGAGTPSLLRTAGVYAPVQPLLGYSVTAHGRAGRERRLRTHVVFEPYHLYVTRLGDDVRFTCYGELAPVGAAARGGVDQGTVVLRSRLRQLVEHAIPHVADMCEWERAVDWCGARPLTPDCQPLVGPTRVKGLWLNAGHSFNGWREAVHSSRLLVARLRGAEVLPGEQYASALSPSRFQPWPPRGRREEQ